MEGRRAARRHQHQVVRLEDRRESVAAWTHVDDDLGVVIDEAPDLSPRIGLGGEHEHAATGGGGGDCAHRDCEVPLHDPTCVQVVMIEREDDAAEGAPSGRDGEDRNLGQRDEVRALPPEDDVGGKSRAPPADHDEGGLVLRDNGRKPVGGRRVESHRGVRLCAGSSRAGLCRLRARTGGRKLGPSSCCYGADENVPALRHRQARS